MVCGPTCGAEIKHGGSQRTPWKSKLRALRVSVVNDFRRTSVSKMESLLKPFAILFNSFVSFRLGTSYNLENAEFVHPASMDSI